jgi:hypothetical protein
MTGTAGSPLGEAADGAVCKRLDFSQEDDGKVSIAPERPPFSYARLTAMAIDASQDKRCTVATIYTWITERFPYYRQGKPWWKVRRKRGRPLFFYVLLCSFFLLLRETHRTPHSGRIVWLLSADDRERETESEDRDETEKMIGNYGALVAPFLSLSLSPSPPTMQRKQKITEGERETADRLLAAVTWAV